MVEVEGAGPGPDLDLVGFELTAPSGLEVSDEEEEEEEAIVSLESEVASFEALSTISGSSVSVSSFFTTVGGGCCCWPSESCNLSEAASWLLNS